MPQYIVVVNMMSKSYENMKMQRFVCRLFKKMITFIKLLYYLFAIKACPIYTL